mgnify:FL=1
MKKLLDIKYPGVACLNLFTQEFCELLLEELKFLKKEVPFVTFVRLLPFFTGSPYFNFLSEKGSFGILC